MRGLGDTLTSPQAHEVELYDVTKLTDRELEGMIAAVRLAIADKDRRKIGFSG